MKDSTAETLGMIIIATIGYGLIWYYTSVLVAIGVLGAIWANNIGQG
jgi:hypothetical protein